MRFIIYASVLFAVLPLVFYRPFFGLCVYYVVSILQPKVLCWRDDFQDALLVGVPLVIGAIAIGTVRREIWAERDDDSGGLRRLQTQVKRDPLVAPHWLIGVFAILVIYVAGTRYLVDIPPIHTSYQFKGLCKILLVTALLTGMVSDYRRLKIFFIVIAFSAGFWAIKGGVKILLIGPHQVYGKSYDNNLFALISVMALPLVFYGTALVRKTKWRPVFLICAGLICLGIIGSRSRAGFVAFAVVLCMMAWGSRYRFRALIGVGIVALTAVAFLGPEIIERVESIIGYREDKSAYSRFYTWTVARVLFEQNPLIGVGFGNFELAKDAVFGGRKAAHSIYLSNLAELGIFGHPLWLCLIFGTMISLMRFIRRAKRLPPGLGWPYSLGRALLLSMLGYAIHGAFHNEEYLELMFALVGLTVALQVVTERELAKTRLLSEAEDLAESEIQRKKAQKDDVSKARKRRREPRATAAPITIGSLIRATRERPSM